MAGEITLKELSPSLRELIENCQGGSGGSGSINIKTDSVTATQENQTIFAIPFIDFEQETCHLDVRINSTWISPDLYVILPTREIQFTSGVVNGTKIFFTMIGGTTGVRDTVRYEVISVAHNLNKYPIAQTVLEHFNGYGVGGAGEGKAGGSELVEIPYKIKYKDKNNLSVIVSSEFEKFGTPSLAQDDSGMYHISFATGDRSLTLILV